MHHGRMQIPDERLQEFQCIYKEECGEEISLAEARKMEQRLLTLYAVLKRPLLNRDEQAE